jgi:hypothetical protein
LDGETRPGFAILMPAMVRGLLGDSEPLADFVKAHSPMAEAGDLAPALEVDVRALVDMAHNTFLEFGSKIAGQGEWISGAKYTP